MTLAAPPTALPDFSQPQWQTPAMKQFARFKASHPDCLLLFRMGDFYELFGPDAETAHRALGITLTQRTKGMPMAGVPHHAIDTYLARLVEQGYRVAICDQIQDPKDAKGVVDRAVTRVLTPGTLVDEALLKAGEANVIAAIALNGDTAGLATAELSTGTFTVSECRREDLPDTIARLGPAELLLDEEHDLDTSILTSIPTSLRPGWMFRREDAENLLRTHFAVASLEGFGFEANDPTSPAAGALLRYLLDTQPGGAEPLAHLRPPRRIRTGATMTLDAATIRSLELDKTAHSGDAKGSLRSVFKGCKTPMGRRTLRSWLVAPLLDIEEIHTRQRAVAALVEDRSCADAIAEGCALIQDVARIGGRIAVGRATPRDLVALADSINAAHPLQETLRDRPALATVHAAIARVLTSIAPLGESIATRITDMPPAHIRDGGVMRDGIDAVLDEARGLSRDAHSWLAEYQAKLIEATGISSLKVGFNKVFGYYIEISKAKALDEVIPPIFVRKQTLKNAERYITPDLKTFEDNVLGAEARAIEREKTLFAEQCAEAAKSLDALAEFADAIAVLDCLACFAETAHRLDWVQPTVDQSRDLRIRDGRHPVLDEMMRDGFVPNDTTLCADGAGTLALITGPNMAGKSTYIRQTALIVLLAQAGSFVPAAVAKIGRADRIFTRVGANDELHAGRSTFMVEMTEMANILNNSTPQSLVILDEIGRGTSTLDGLSLAWAIVETLLAKTTRTLFATHYHELTSIAERDEGVTNFHVAVREWQGSIVFLHRIKPGRTDRSYGIHVGKLAGLPATTTDRAEAILKTLEVRDNAEVPQRTTAASPQMALFKEYLDHPAIEELKSIDIDALSPMSAFEILRRLTSAASSKA